MNRRIIATLPDGQRKGIPVPPDYARHEEVDHGDEVQLVMFISIPAKYGDNRLMRPAGEMPNGVQYRFPKGTTFSPPSEV